MQVPPFKLGRRLVLLQRGAVSRSREEGILYRHLPTPGLHLNSTVFSLPEPTAPVDQGLQVRERYPCNPCGCKTLRQHTTDERCPVQSYNSPAGQWEGRVSGLTHTQGGWLPEPHPTIKPCGLQRVTPPASVPPCRVRQKSAHPIW